MKTFAWACIWLLEFSCFAEVYPFGKVPYKGKYADTPFGKVLARDLPRWRREASERVAKRIGVTPDAGAAIAILIVDAESLDEKGLKKWKRQAFDVGRSPEGSAAPVVVRLYTEPLAAAEAEPVATLARALAEAAFLVRFSDKELKRISPWVLEGLAAYAGGEEEGEAAVARILASRRKSWDSLVGDLEGAHGEEDLAQDFWAFLYLEKAHGSKSVSAFGAALYEGKPYDEALMVLTGAGWGVLTGGVAAFAKKEMEPLASGLEAFKALETRFRDVDDQARGRFSGEIQELLARHRQAAWADKARYLLGQSHEAAGRFEAAAEAFRSLAEGDPPRGPQAGPARYRLGRVLEERGKLDEAAREYARCTADYFDETFADECLERLCAIAARRRDGAGEARWRAEIAKRKRK